MMGITTRQALLGGEAGLDIDALVELAAAELTLQETGGLLTATGAEDTVYINGDPLGTFNPRVLIVDLDNMQGGDTTVLRVYYRITAGGGLQLEDYQAYVGADGGLANSIKLVTIALNPNRFGIQLTLEQTAGVNRTYRWEYFEEA
ncbi:hypothetical protein LCGC14_0500440 [marine sediment metagenome]|uniref:Uncharacterized protein n=1 Tax=marine sediment metagenome TaxID=412755 RepID=A0A0F9S421_9ZZZZ